MPNPTYDKMKKLLLKIEFILTVYKSKNYILEPEQALEQIYEALRNAYPKGL